MCPNCRAGVAARVLILFCIPAIAPPVAAQVIDEVTVTAQKREQSIQDVGIAITAFSGDQLDALGLTDTTDLERHVPGLMVTDIGSAVTTVFNIRGVSQNDFADHHEPPVAVYTDGAYVSYLGGVGMNMFDLERVEVLKGPQGTLFGRNATGGLVHLISRRPTFEPEARVRLSLGEYQQRELEGAVSGPLSERIAGRLAFSAKRHDGPWRDPDGPADKGDADSLSVRGQLLFDVSEDVQILLNLRASRVDVNDSPWVPRRAYFRADGLVGSTDFDQFVDHCESFFGLTGLGALIPPDAVDCFSGLAPAFGLGPAFTGDGDIYTIDHDRNGGLDRDYLGATLEVSWQTAIGELVSITNFQSFEKEYGPEDTDATPYRLLEFFQSQDADDFSQELRLSGDTDRLHWITGFYYLSIDSDLNAGTAFYPDLDFLAFDAVLDNDYSTETRSWAVFAQAELDLAPRWSLVGGLRWTDDRMELQFRPGCTGPLCAVLVFPGMVQESGFTDAVPGADTTRSSGDWSGKLQLNWHPRADWLAYAGITRGQKAGGYNAGSYAPWTVDQSIFDDEILTSYEAGLKATLFGGAARLNLTGFYYDYQDIQVFTFQGTTLFVYNSDGSAQGAEVELIANPAEGWEFLLGAAFLDTEVEDIEQGFLGPRDTQMINAPELTLNGLGRYEWSAFGGSMGLQVDASWVDERKLNIIDHPATLADAYLLVNARAYYATDDGRWEFEVFGENLTDEEYVVTTFQLPDITGSAIDIYGLPRWAGVSVTYRWD